ncbi:cell division protein FtsB [Pseudoxanthomonas kalamensis DSM 18571]|uniref:cell division protein FtsB n=1 Tax=Pseudoxanthomonas kalamensis TaxID=289483 RepID=UPI001391B1E5|nr:cell division protein FtsB [Pseudoxanthomonas kalamensis]KAF1711207.1 cell division protein FtsB [Pseudoxanthomonas kalamensis DSM 18571]
MRGMRWLLLVLALLLGVFVYLQYQFWFGRANSGEVVAMESRVASQRQENDGLRDRNARLAAEVEDLKSGGDAVEERARSELGMIKPGETFYRVVEEPAPADAERADADTEAQP